MLDDVFGENNPQIDHRTDGNSDSGKCHNVGIYTKIAHGNEHHKHRDG